MNTERKGSLDLPHTENSRVWQEILVTYSEKPVGQNFALNTVYGKSVAATNELA
jgi:hypothetical protein